MRRLKQYRLRLRRKRRLVQAFAQRRKLRSIQDNTHQIGKEDIVLICTLRNERIRLPYFLKYYRDLGVKHFLFVDNDSDDGSREYLTGEDDISIWHTTASYREALYGVHWMNWLARKYCHDRWTLTVDVDEFFTYPFCDTRPLSALTDWLDSSEIRSFSAMLIDMYPKGQIGARSYHEGQDPMEITQWFDSGNYTIKQNYGLDNLWIQGGPRARAFFENDPENAPSLNKIPLVKWDKAFAYVESTHMLLPKRLNRVYERNGGEQISGALLHTKFLDTFVQKAKEEADRRQHYSDGREYVAYHEKLNDDPDLWCSASEKYINWRQLELLGLISKGNWV